MDICGIKVWRIEGGWACQHAYYYSYQCQGTSIQYYHSMVGVKYGMFRRIRDIVAREYIL